MGEPTPRSPRWKLNQRVQIGSVEAVRVETTFGSGISALVGLGQASNKSDGQECSKKVAGSGSVLLPVGKSFNWVKKKLGIE